jgi:type I site-specific restriction-modification system R (restriction) subunit
MYGPDIARDYHNPLYMDVLTEQLHNFILFSSDTPEDIKITAAHHQYFAVRKAVASTVRAAGLTKSLFTA